MPCANLGTVIIGTVQSPCRESGAPFYLGHFRSTSLSQLFDFIFLIFDLSQCHVSSMLLFNRLQLWCSDWNQPKHLKINDSYGSTPRLERSHLVAPLEEILLLQILIVALLFTLIKNNNNRSWFSHSAFATSSFGGIGIGGNYGRKIRQALAATTIAI